MLNESTFSMRVGALLSLVIVVYASVVTSEEFKVGDKVTVTKDGATISVGDDIVDTLAAGESLNVIDVSGPFLKIGRDKTGWISKTDVVSFDRAIDYFTNKVGREPDNLTWRYARAIVRHERGELDEAISDFTDLIRLDPTNSANWNGRGGTRLDKGDYDGAIADFSESMKLNSAQPNHLFDNYFNRGLARYLKEDYEGAITDFTQAIRLKPMSALAHVKRGNVKLAQMVYDGAIDDFTIALHIDPKSIAAYNNRGIARGRKQDYKGAIEDYSAAIRIDPSYAMGYFNRGSTYERTQRYSDAIADYEDAIKLDPTHADSYLMLSELLAGCPDARFRSGTQAIGYAKRAIGILGDNDPRALSTLAAAYAENGNFDEAVKWQTKALHLASDEDESEFRSHLDLYKSHKPYRQDIDNE